MGTITAFVALSLVLLVTASVSAQTTGAVTGCLRDVTDQPLPRATVTATAAGTKVTILADAGGCFEFTELPPNVYRVTARMPGLDNTTRDNVAVVAGQVQRVDLVTGPSIICECLSNANTLRELFDRADAVIYLRILDPTNDQPVRRRYFRQRAAILDVLKRHDGVVSDMTFLQDQSSGEPDPYRPGEEFAVFLSWLPGARTFVASTARMTHIANESYAVVAIQNGRVTSTQASLAHYLGAPRENLLADLRKIADGK